MRTVSLKDMGRLDVNPQDRRQMLFRKDKPEPVKKTDQERLAESIESMSAQLVEISKGSENSLKMVASVLAKALEALSKKPERKPVSLRIKISTNKDGSKEAEVREI